jgi:GT2 family glycosyltransferase
MRTAYFILAMHRSGTSAFGGVLSTLGIAAGSDLIPGTKDNPKGYFENRNVLILNENIQAENHSNWSDYRFDFNNISSANVKKYIAQAKEIIINDYKYSESFFIKDPRICLLFPIWKAACKELGIQIKAVLPIRNPLEVAESLRKRDGFIYEESLLLWLTHFFLAEKYSREYERIFISFDDLINNTPTILNQLESFTGVKASDLAQKEVDKFIEKGIKNNNFPLNNFVNEAPKFLTRIVSQLEIGEFNDLELIDELRNEFLYNKDLFQNKLVKDTLSHVKNLEMIRKYNKEEVENLQIQNQELKKLNKSFDNQAQHSQNEVAVLIQQKTTHERDLQALKKKILILENQLSEKQEISNTKINNLNLNIELQKNKIEKLHLELKETQLETIEYKTILSVKDNEINRLNKKIDTANNKIVQSKVRISLSKEQKKSLSSLVAEKETENNELMQSHFIQQQQIKDKILEIKLKAEQAIEQNVNSWNSKVLCNEQYYKYALKNLQLFQKITNHYLGSKKDERAKLQKEIQNTNSKYSKYFNPIKLARMLEKVRHLELDLITIENKLNRIPWQFIEHYQEKGYLEANPDIKEEVSSGKLLNGLEHFIFFGIDEVLNQGRLIHPSIPKYVANETCKTTSEIEYDFRKYLESCYIKRSINIDNNINLALNEFDTLLNEPISKELNSLLEQKSLSITKIEPAIIDVENDDLQPIHDSEKNEDVTPYHYYAPELTEDIKTIIANFKISPLISIIMPVYNVDPKWLNLAIASIKSQWYQNWELCIADDKSSNQETLDYLNNIDDKRIKIHFAKENGNISVASNNALTMTKGSYIALMDNDDEITPNALFEVVKVINEYGSEFIYSDEDKLEMDGSFSDPHFKPDFSPEMFHSQNYLSHFGVIKSSLIQQVNGFTVGLEGSQDFDLYLKILEHTDKIHHIQKVLYHWRKVPGSTAAVFSDKSYAQDAGVTALENAMARRKIEAQILNGKYPGTYRVKYKIHHNPLVSIIIPFKDMPDLLKMCIESILEKSTYKNFEIIGISNNSEETATFDEMRRLEELDSRINFYEYNVPFNYSQINNYAVNKYAKGEHVILLNNDIEIITPEWIESLLEFSQREDVGAVGAKLFYPNDTIQHAGVAIGVLSLAGHNFKHHPRNAPAYMGRESVIQNVSAVTAACLMVKKSVFNLVKGLNEDDLKIAFNDIDFCLRIQEMGYINVFTPYCEAYHHESISRGLEDTPEKQKRFLKEVVYTQVRHKEVLQNGDPYYNPNLSLESENFSLKQ